MAHQELPLDADNPSRSSLADRIARNRSSVLFCPPPRHGPNRGLFIFKFLHVEFILHSLHYLRDTKGRQILIESPK